MSKTDISTSWWADKFLEVLSQMGIGPYLEAGLEHEKRKRAIDLFISPGVITARLQGDNSRYIRAKISVPVVQDSLWQIIFSEMSSKALFRAKLLAGIIPIELESVFKNAGTNLIPNSPDEVDASCNCRQHGIMCKHLAAVYFHIVTYIDNNPFSLLAFRGRGRERTLFEMSELRPTIAKSSNIESTSVGYRQVNYKPAPPLHSTLENFYNGNDIIKELIYTIRADELPASILRQLDPLPIGKIGAEVEFALEDAYAQVARRAQALGLGL